LMSGAYRRKPGKTSRIPPVRHVPTKIEDGGRRESVPHGVRSRTRRRRKPRRGAELRRLHRLRGHRTHAGSKALKSRAFEVGVRATAQTSDVQRHEGKGPGNRARLRGKDEPLKGANPGCGSGVKQTRKAGGGENRRGRAKRRGRNEAVGWVPAATVDAAGLRRNEGANPMRGVPCAAGRSQDCSEANGAGRGSWCSEEDGKLAGG